MRLDVAAEFVDLLAGDDPVTWQTFDDNAKRKDGKLARILHGGLKRHGDELKRLNSLGAGVFVCVNRTDLKGRRTENVVGLRALFTDDDGDGIRDYRLSPAFVVQSRRGPQAYWPLRPEEALGRFPVAQKSLAGALNTDGKVCDLARVMRVPGFWHCKGEPFMVGLEVAAPGVMYSIDEVLLAYPQKIKALSRQMAAGRNGEMMYRTKHPDHTRRFRDCNDGASDAMQRAARYAEACGPAVEGAGGDLHTFKLACKLLWLFGLSDADAFVVLRRWNLGCSPLWTFKELELKITNARKYGNRVS